MNKKICSKCGVEKDITEYNVKNSSKDGLRKDCKKCQCKYAKDYREKNKESLEKCRIEYTKKNKKMISENKKRYYKENKEILIEKNKKYYQDNRPVILEYFKQYNITNKEERNRYRKKNKESIKKYRKKYYEINKEKIIETHKKYVEKNRFELNKYRNQYAKEHRDLPNIVSQRYNSKKKQLPSTLTVDQWNQCKEYFDNKCAYCGEEKPLAQDHFIPLSKGGWYTKENIIPACKNCNCSKKDKLFEDWYITRSYYSEERELKIFKYLCKQKGEQMEKEYSDDYLRRMYSELGYDELLPFYEFVDRVKSGQLAIDDERLDNND